jgi:hypothetical protein
VIVLLLLNSNGLTVAVALELCIGRVYANTLLYNSTLCTDLCVLELTLGLY